MLMLQKSGAFKSVKTRLFERILLVKSQILSTCLLRCAVVSVGARPANHRLASPVVVYSPLWRGPFTGVGGRKGSGDAWRAQFFTAYLLGIETVMVAESVQR